MSTDIVVNTVSAISIAQGREPEVVLSEAKRAASALKSIIEQKPKKVMFNNEQYLEREDWGTVARFYGCTAKPTSTSYVRYGDVQGFEATAVVLDANMSEIGRAESMCLDDEENWGAIPKYEWKDILDENGKKIWDAKARNGKGGYKAEKVQVGFTRKPLFQLRSMAQTRAEAKALKSVFGWVVVLAGYRPTPAEEMTGNEFNYEEERTQVQQPSRASSSKQDAPGGEGSRKEEPGKVEITTKINEVREGRNGAWWMSTDSGLVMVPNDKFDPELVAGATIRISGEKSFSERIGDYVIMSALREVQHENLTGIIPEDKQEPKPEAEKTPAQQEVESWAEDIHPDGHATVQEMVDRGQLVSASSLNPPPSVKTIGTKRAQRLYTIAGQNAKSTGLTEANIKKLMSKLPIPIEHLRDLEMGMESTFEKYCTGEENWRELVGE